MKKLISILALALTLCLVLGVAWADESATIQHDSEFDGWAYEEVMRIHEIKDHDVKNPRVVREATCTTQGIIRFECESNPSHFHEVYFEELGHDWTAWAADAQCNLTRTCNRCKTTQTKKGSHIWSSDWNNWSDEEKEQYKPYDSNLSSENNSEFFWGRVIVEPTCTSEGLAIDFCPRCGATREDKTRVIEKLPHMYHWETIHWPTCAEYDNYYERVQYCSVCGIEGAHAIQYTDNVEEWQHDWDEWIVTEEPTCLEEGRMLRWCPVCGDKQEGVIPTLEPDWVMMDSRLIDCYHKEGTWVCSRCQGKAEGHGPETIVVPVVAHEFIQSKEYEVERVNPTCEEDGYVIYKCIHWDSDHTGHDEAEHDEDGYLTVRFPALDHIWSEWELRYDVHYEGQDNVNGYWLSECTRCHKTRERISPYAPECAEDAHNYVATGETQDPWCDIDGWVEYQCTICGKYDYEIIPQLDHVWDKQVVTPATIFEDGLAVNTCTRCWATIPEVIPQLDASKVQAFVVRCFDKILGRAASEEEVNNYADALAGGTMNAAEVVSNFVNSPEAGATEDFDLVETLYNTMLDRGTENDQTGYDHWAGIMDDGLSNNYLVNGFAGSQEFLAICRDYGIEAGSVGTEARDRNRSVTAFVTRCYHEALNRAGDPAGLNDWTSQLMGGTNTPQGVAYGFVFSTEFNAAEKIANGEAKDVITALYGLYLDREPSEGEVAHYESLLADGMSLEEMNYMFAYSDEFQNIILTYNMYPEV